MLSITTLHSTKYLTDAVEEAREAYYTDAVREGEPPGRWYGRGADLLHLSGTVDADLMEAVFSEGLDPRAEATHSRSTWGLAPRLGKGPKKFRSTDEHLADLLKAHPSAGPEERAELRRDAQRRTHHAVMGFDLTFSPPKSVTLLRVACERRAQLARRAGDLELAEVWQARQQAVREAEIAGSKAGFAWVEEHACYARVGHHGGGAGKWVSGHGLTVALFPQSDSRERDPQDHVHGAVRNQVFCPHDQAWRAVDGKAVFAARPAAGAVMERVCEATLVTDHAFGEQVLPDGRVVEALALRFETRPDGKARELVGVRQESRDIFSARRAALTPAGEALIARFTARYGREPNGVERYSLLQQATLDTRKAKTHTSESSDEQIDRWAGKFHAGCDRELDTVLDDIKAASQNYTKAGAAQWSPQDVVERALASIGSKMAAWTRWDLAREVSDALPAHLDLPAERIAELLETLTDQALDRAVGLTPDYPIHEVPAELCREDGTPMRARPAAARYATPDQLTGEQTLRDAAVVRGAATLSLEAANTLIAAYAESGAELGADQAAALRGVLTSGAFLEVICAPAGTGKSFTVGVIADAWHHPTEARRVFGLAPTQAVTELLAGDGLTAANLAAWTATQHRLGTGPASATDEPWRLRGGDLVVVDEAEMATTAHLLAVAQRCAAAGAKLLLVGDPAQLSAVGPGGAFADLAQRAPRYELAEVRRFTQAWEGPASLRLRERDVDVLADYATHGRLVAVDGGGGGTVERAGDEAARNWLADTLAGKEALLLCDTNTTAARLNMHLRDELVRLHHVESQGVGLTTHGGVAGVGDLVQARRIAWHLRGFEGNSYAPINRHTYRVQATRTDGALVVARVLGRDADGDEIVAAPIVLPADYVADHVALGYASTQHAALGRTVDTAHTVIDPATTSPASLYAGLSRGREGNWAYVTTRAVSPEAETGETLDVHPVTAHAVLAGILDPDTDEQIPDRNSSALTYQEAAAEQAKSTPTFLDPLIDDAATLVHAARISAVLDRLAAQGVLPAERRAELAADQDCTRALAQLLRTVELAGHDPDQVLSEAAGRRGFHGARSAGQVLYGRIRRALPPDRLTPRITEFTDLIPQKTPQRLRSYFDELAAGAEARRVELGHRAATELPRWAVDHLGPPPEEALPRAVWEYKAGWAAAYRELVGHTDPVDPLGRPPSLMLAERVALWRTARTHLGLPEEQVVNPMRERSDAALRILVQAWERERNWAPPRVDDHLETTYQAARKRRADATLFTAHAAAADDPRARERLATDAATAEHDAAQLEEQIRQLEEVADARGAWWAATAVTRDAAAHARAEAQARGLNLDTAAEDTTTAAGYLTDHTATAATAAAGEAAQLAGEDAHRRVGESDVSDPEIEAYYHQPHPLPDDGLPVAETALGEVRDSTRHPSEEGDPRERCRVPSLADTQALVQRAHQATAELLKRARAEEEQVWRGHAYGWAGRDQTAQADSSAEAGGAARWEEEQGLVWQR